VRLHFRIRRTPKPPRHPGVPGHTAPPTAPTARAALVARMAEAEGDLEIVAVDSGDRNYLYRTLDAQLRSRSGTTLINIEADLGRGTSTNKILESVVSGIATQLRVDAQRSIDDALLALHRQVRYESSRPTQQQVNIELHVGDHSEVTLTDSANVAVSAATAATEERNLSDELAEIAAAGTRMHGGRMVALIDHAEWFSDSQIGREWLRRYTELARPHAVIHMLVQPSPPPPPRWVRREELQPFQDDDIRELLPLNDPHGGVVSVIREAAHNEPWLIHILVSQVTQNAALTEADLRHALAGGGSSKGIWDFLNRFVFTGDRAYLKAVVQRLSVLRRLDDAVVEAVVADVLPPGTTLATVYEDLRRTHLVDDDAMPQVGTPGFRLLDRVAAVAAEEVAKVPEAGHQVHRLATEHYWALVDPTVPESDGADEDGDDEDSVDAGYQQYWTRFESNEWLGDLQEWIHHSRHTAAFQNPKSRRAVRQKLMRWYLEGFFWFEILASHHFCRELIREWEAWANGVPEEQEWLGHIKTFHTTFGRGAFPNAREPRPDWDAARDAIALIRRGILLSANARPPQKATDESACYALAMHLEAETIRVSGDRTAFRHADRLYRDAYEWHVDDIWAQAWTIHDRVSLALTGGSYDTEAALADISEVGRLAEQEEDRELQSLALCRFAEILSTAGRHAEAAQAAIAGLTVMLDYNTKQEPALREPNNFPNEYTRESYLEIESVASKVLRRVIENGQLDVKRRFDAVCAELFAPFAEVSDPLRGWPPPPAPEDLNHTGSQWLARARRAVRQAENTDVLSKTVNTPMPWFDAFEDGLD
jgi:hypothetical protein